MADASRSGNDSTGPATPTRWAGLAVVVLAGIALAINLAGWWAGEKHVGRGSIMSVGIGLLGLGLVVGPQRRPVYSLFIGASLALLALSFVLALVRP